MEQPKVARQFNEVAAIATDRAVSLHGASEGELRAVLRTRQSNSYPLQDTSSALVDRLSAVIEAWRRIHGDRPKLELLIQAVALFAGNVIELKRKVENRQAIGMAACLHGAHGIRPHIGTQSTCLAEDQHLFMKPVFDLLALRAALLIPSMSVMERRKTYLMDITYGEIREFCLDYLHDSQATDHQEFVQDAHQNIILDQIDAALIDRAFELIVTDEPSRSTEDGTFFLRAAETLEAGMDYHINESSGHIRITQQGEQKIFDIFRLRDAQWNLDLINAIKAIELYQRGRDYFVSDNNELELTNEGGGAFKEVGTDHPIQGTLAAREQLRQGNGNVVTAFISPEQYFLAYSSITGTTHDLASCTDELAANFGTTAFPAQINSTNLRQRKSGVIKRRSSLAKMLPKEVQGYRDTEQEVLILTSEAEARRLVCRILDDSNIPYRSAWNFSELETLNTRITRGSVYVIHPRLLAGLCRDAEGHIEYGELVHDELIAESYNISVLSVGIQNCSRWDIWTLDLPSESCRFLYPLGHSAIWTGIGSRDLISVFIPASALFRGWPKWLTKRISDVAKQIQRIDDRNDLKAREARRRLMRVIGDQIREVGRLRRRILTEEILIRYQDRETDRNSHAIEGDKQGEVSVGSRLAAIDGLWRIHITEIERLLRDDRLVNSTMGAVDKQEEFISRIVELFEILRDDFRIIRSGK